MTTRVEAAPAPSPVVQWLREELAIRPGRATTVVRISLCSTLVVIIWMLFRIPLPAYAAYVVFLMSSFESTTTLIASAGALIAATLAITVSLALYALDSGEPALRLPLMAIAVFGGMFLSRTISIGPIAFLASFLLVMAQTLIDDAPNLEALTHLVLWLWVVVAVPVVITALAHLLSAPDAAQAARSSGVRVLRRLAAALRQPVEDGPGGLDGLPQQIAALVELRGKANMARHDLRALTPLDLRLIDSLDELASLIGALPATVPPEVREPLAAAAQGCAQALEAGSSPVADLGAVNLTAVDERSRPTVVAIVNVLKAITEGLALRGKPLPAGPVHSAARSLVVPDAFTNPDHVRFALKTTLAVMSTYVLYTALDWPGIRTCMVTCFFVALGTTGESLHKLSLRMAGAMLGAAIGAVTLVFVIPHMSDIGDLALLVFVVSAACAWVSTGSDLIAYAGLQMAFAFYVGVLQGLEPPTELTVLRDRVMGILIGNVVMTVVFSSIWPVSALGSARAAVAAVYRALGQRLLEARKSLSEAMSAPIDVASALNRARRLLTISAFEGPLGVASTSPAVHERQILEDLKAVEAAAWVAINQTPQDEEAQAAQTGNRAIGHWLIDSAADLAGDRIAVGSLDEIKRLATPSAPGPSGSAMQAQQLLASTIERVASHAA
jgi:multidrug resistance protein MdtO